MNTILTTLKSRFGADGAIARDNLAWVSTSPDTLPQLITHLRDYEGFTQLIFLTAVDRIEDKHFQLTYMLADKSSEHNIGIRVLLDRDKAVMNSIHHLWHHAKTYQRELKEMYGIDFPGSPGVDDSFILEGWEEIPPMRRDFDTKAYAEKTYFPRPGRSTTEPRDAMKELDKKYPELPELEGGNA